MHAISCSCLILTFFFAAEAAPQTSVTWNRQALGQKFRCDPANPQSEWSFPNNNNWSQSVHFGEQCQPGVRIMTQPSNWSTPDYPNAADVNVTLGDAVNLDVPVRVNRLIIPAGGVLNMQFGSSLAAAEVEFAGGGGITVSGGGGGWPALNISANGLILKSGGSDVFSIDPGVVISAAGLTVQVDAGTLKLPGNGTRYQGGNFVIGPGATVDLVPPDHTALFTGLFTGSGSGTLELRAGILAAADGATFNMPARFFRWSGGVIAGPGFTNAGAINLATTNGTGIGGVFVNEGVVSQVLEGGLNIPFGASWMNQSGSVFELAGDSSITAVGGGGATPQFFNRGTLRKSAGSGQSKISALFHNIGGTVEADAGTLVLAGGGTSSNGFLRASAESTLDITGGSTASWEGLFQGAGAGVIQLASGTLQAGQSGLTLDFPASLFQWTGGTLSGGTQNSFLTNRGTITASGAAGKNIGGLLNNAGTLILTNEGSLNIPFGGMVQNLAGALLDLQSDADITAQSGGGATPQLRNFGLLRKSGGAGETRIDPMLDHRDGPLEVQSGILALNGGSSVSNAAITVASGAELNLIAGSQDAVWSGHITGSGAGRIALRGGTLHAGPGGLMLDLPLGLFQWFGGSLQGGTSDSFFTNIGSILLLGEDGKNIGGQILNAGRLTQAGLGALNLPFGSRFRNLPSGTIDLQSDAPLTASGGGGATPSILNEGLVLKTRGSNTTVDANIAFENADTLRVLRGKLTFPRGYRQIAGSTELAGGSIAAGEAIRIEGGSITGSGVIDGSVENNGTIQAGTNVIQLTGNLAFLPNGALDVDLALSATGLVQVAGSARLAGTLRVTPGPGRVIHPGDEFVVLTFSSRTGTFSGISGDSVDGGLTLVPDYRTNAVVLVARNLPFFRTVSYLSGTISFGFVAALGKTYEVQATDSLPAPNWQVVQTIEGNGAIASLSLPAGTAPMRFFRIRELPAAASVPR